jgi:hypothetical protein
VLLTKKDYTQKMTALSRKPAVKQIEPRRWRKIVIAQARCWPRPGIERSLTLTKLTAATAAGMPKRK